MNSYTNQHQILSYKNMIKLVFLIFFPFVSHTVPCVVEWENLSEGKINKIQMDAEKGDVEAQFNLGRMYEEGEGGFLQNWDMASLWTARAIQEELSIYNALKRSIDHRKINEIINHVERAANKGSIRAQLDLALMYSKGLGVEKNLDEAMLWYKKALKRSYEYEQFDFNRIGGTEAEKSFTEFFDVYKQDAEQGYAPAQLTLGQIYKKGIGAEKNLAKAFFWTQRAALQGSKEAQVFLGRMNEEGEGVEKNLNAAMFWYKRAAEQGYGVAQVFLARIYSQGEGVEKNLNEAFHLLMIAAKQREYGGSVAFPRPYREGEGVEKNLNEAFHLLKKAAEQREYGGSVAVPRPYREGEGVEKNINKAFHLLMIAAEQNHPEAQFMVAEMYAKGEVVGMNMPEAIRWYKEAAKQGNIDAQRKLIRMYIEGEGVKKNLSEAFRWVKKVAEQREYGGLWDIFGSVAFPRPYREGEGVKVFEEPL